MLPSAHWKLSSWSLDSSSRERKGRERKKERLWLTQPQLSNHATQVRGPWQASARRSLDQVSVQWHSEPMWSQGWRPEATTPLRKDGQGGQSVWGRDMIGTPNLGHAAVCLLPLSAALTYARLSRWGHGGSSILLFSRTNCMGFVTVSITSSSSWTYKCFYIFKMWHMFCLYYHAPINVFIDMAINICAFREGGVCVCERVFKITYFFKILLQTFGGIYFFS